MQFVVVLVVLAAVAVGGYVVLKKRNAGGDQGPGAAQAQGANPNPTATAPAAGTPASVPDATAGTGQEVAPNGAAPKPDGEGAETPKPPPPPTLSLAELDRLYKAYFLDEPTKDRKQWENLRAQYSAALKAIDDPAARKPVIEKLNELNKKILFSRDFLTADAVAHKVEPGETMEKIALDSTLPRDCSGSIARINRTAPERIRVGDTLKVIKPLSMDIRVSKKHLRLTAYLNGYFFGEFPVGIGMDDATPAGEFVIKSHGKDKNPNWTKTLEDGSKRVYKFGDPENILGTRWMGLDEKEGAVGLGIHGTTKDDTVPGRKSAGCIRMHNADVELLYDFTPDGTKVTIVE